MGRIARRAQVGVGPYRAGSPGQVLERWNKVTGWPGRCPAGRLQCRAMTHLGIRMWYAIEGFDGPDVLAQRLAARPQHLARLTNLRDEGRLLVAGPCPAIDAEEPGPAGFSGSIVIAEFASLDAARAWADADPYIEAGVYLRVEVRPFKRVLP